MIQDRKRSVRSLDLGNRGVALDIQHALNNDDDAFYFINKICRGPLSHRANEDDDVFYLFLQEQK